MTKVRYTPGLSAAAKRLLQNVEHTSRKIAGTQETRRQMRFDTNANRIRYGVPIFVTFTPDEAHNCLMLRLSRCRQNEPVFADGRDPELRTDVGRVVRPEADFEQVGVVAAAPDQVRVVRDLVAVSLDLKINHTVFVATIFAIKFLLK